MEWTKWSRTNVDYTEPFVPIDDVIPVAMAKDPSSNYIWVLNCRISRHLDAILYVSLIAFFFLRLRLA